MNFILITEILVASI